MVLQLLECVFTWERASVQTHCMDQIPRFFLYNRSRLILILVDCRIMIQSGWSDPPMKFQNACLDVDQLIDLW